MRTFITLITRKIDDNKMKPLQLNKVLNYHSA